MSNLLIEGPIVFATHNEDKIRSFKKALKDFPVDILTAGSLGIEVDFSRPAERVIRSLNRIIEWCGKPYAIRVDIGPEYVSRKLMEWAKKQGIGLTHIQPGKPQQNACVERYNRTVRHEWLGQNIIESIEKAQELATQWLWTCNNEPPNMGIVGITPAQKLKKAARILPQRPVENGSNTRLPVCSLTRFKRRRAGLSDDGRSLHRGGAFAG